MVISNLKGGLGNYLFQRKYFWYISSTVHTSKNIICDNKYVTNKRNNSVEQNFNNFQMYVRATMTQTEHEFKE